MLTLGGRKGFDALFPGFWKALAEWGWEQDRNLTTIWPSSERREGQEATAAADVVAARPDAILTGATALTRAAQKATRSIPIVTQVADPILSGFAQSLARPGGNITGLSFRPPEVDGKAIELLVRAVPRISRLTILFPRSFEADRPEYPAHVAAAARRAGLEPRIAYHGNRDEVQIAIRETSRARHGALFVGSANGNMRKDITELALAHRVVTVTHNPDYRNWPHKGLLLGFTMRFSDLSARWAAQLDKVLRGEDPATIPFEQPDRSHVIVNRRTAAVLGIEIPADVLLQADEVIE